MKNISFIGLGHMGNPMTKNLLKAGFNVSVYDILPTAIEALIPFGAIPKYSIKDAVKEADIIFTMLQTGQQVFDSCMSENGIFATAKENVLYIDCSSIEIKITRELHSAAKKNHIKMLDAPVSGGVSSATSGSLTIMVGGEELHFQEAMIYLEKLGKKIIYAGMA
ncbi:MAG: NAD(P)-binding domain-containing protein, partial [Gammaproteobacteria bacterium]|nr:NAD(P)-binding domain-containing protein [Gammaproteobacteria bacterium]